MMVQTDENMSEYK